MMPRSSRSHSTQVPADSMMASTPQVIRPPALPGDDREWCRPGPGRPAGAAAGPTHWSSMPAGAEGGLGQARPGAALPDERGLLVAGDAGDDRPCRAGSRPLPPHPRSRRWWGGRARGCAGPPAPGSFQPEPSPLDQPGDPGVGGVGHVQRAAREGPGHPGVDGAEGQLAPLGRDRSGSAWSRRAATLVAEALGATRMPRPWSSRQVPTVRRSCQPMPGTDRAPGGPVPHDGRGPLVGDAHRLDRPALGQAGRGHLEHGRGHGRRRRTPRSPGNGVSGSTGTWWTWSTVAVGADHRAAHARGAHVDDEDAHGQGTGRRRATAGRACPG